MSDLKKNSLAKIEESKNNLVSLINTEDLDRESLDIINQIIAESDLEKTKDLTYLFNVNQNKKTLVRSNKLNELLDKITDQALVRFTSRPDEISNKELIDSMKAVQDLIERGQKQVSGVNSNTTPLIQINQQNNEVNVDGVSNGLNRESRERVKNVVSDLLKGLMQNKPLNQNIEECEIVETEVDKNDK